MTRRPSLGPLQERGFLWYFAARATDLVGDRAGMLALPFVVLEITDSPGALGLVLAAHSVPLVVLLLVGGVIADRFGRTRVIQISNLAAGAAQLGIAALVLTGHAELWHLISLAAVNGVAAAANQPALASLLPQLAPAGHLQAANALIALVKNAATVLVPAVVGLLIAAVGPGWAVGFNGIAYLLAVLLLAPIRLPAPSAESSGSSVVGDLREGWSAVRSTTWLWVVVLAFAALNALYAGGFNTLGPVLAQSGTLGPDGWGLIVSAAGVGMLVASLVLVRVRLPRPLLWGVAGVSCLGLPMMALGLTTLLWVLLLAAFVGGAGMSVFGIGWNLALQENVPEHVLARVYSYDMLGSFLAVPLGQLAFGPLGAALGVQEMLLVAGIMYLVVALLALVPRSVRALPRRTVGSASDQQVGAG